MTGLRALRALCARLRPLAWGLVLATASAAQAGDPARGQALYRQHCTACHGAAGKPVLPGAPDFSRPTALLQSDPDLLARICSGCGGMPAYQGQLRDRDILDIVAHLRTLK